MISLDIAVVNVALPSIQRDLSLDSGDLQWVVVAYGLLLGGFLILGGRMADQFGRRRVFLVGLIVFTAASLAAGLSHRGGVLIPARAVQGFGAALIAPAALALLADTFIAGPARTRAIGLFGAVSGAAAALGVVLGGLLAAGPGWRWAFFINVPTGIVFIFLAVAGLAADPHRDRTARLDVGGAVSVTGGLIGFVYALHHAAEHRGVSLTTLGWFAMSLVLLAMFLQIEKRSRAPLVPPATLHNKTLVVANITAFLTTGALLSFIFVGSLLMQQELHYSPAVTGVAWLATTATIFPASLVGARLVSRLGVRWPIIIGLTLFIAGVLWLTRLPSTGSFVPDLLPSLVLAGLGMGLSGPALQIGALAGVDRFTSGLASGLVETMREVGGAAGVAAISVVLVAHAGLPGFHAAYAAIAVVATCAVVGALVLGATADMSRGTGAQQPLTSPPSCTTGPPQKDQR